MADICRDDWLRAIAEVEAIPFQDDPNSVTVKQFAAAMNLTRWGAEKTLRALVAAGKAATTTKRIQRDDGVIVTVNAYRLV